MLVHPNPSLPEVIAQSWERSHHYAVNRSTLHLDAVDYDPDTRLVRTVEPVLRDLAEHLKDASVSVTFADRSGLIVWRHACSHRAMDALDDHYISPGHSYSEELIGTNGMGTSLATDSPVVVHGPDHYNTALEVYSCASTPIRHPLTKHVLGVVNLMCRAEDFNALMMPTAMRAKVDLERRILDEASQDDRALFDLFLAERRRRQTPIFAINAEICIANDAGLMLGIDHTDLWEALQKTPQNSNFRQVELAVGGVSMNASISPVISGVRFSGAIIRVQGPVRQTVRKSSSDGGRTPWDVTVRTTLSTLSDHGIPMLHGEPGTGKTSALVAALTTRFADSVELSPVRTVNCAATSAIVEPESWFRTAIEALTASSATVFARIDALPNELASRLDDVLRSSAELRGKVGMTIRHDRSRTAFTLADTFGATLHEVPPLREYGEWIEFFARERADRAPGGPRKWTPAALRHLRTYSWPGNLAQFDAVLHAVLATESRAPINASDLPAAIVESASHSRLTPLERTEARVVQAALISCEGNKTAAAEQLQISRTSLYKKIRRYQLNQN